MLIREQLRAAISGTHEALHHAEPFARIARGELDRQGYAALLGTLYAFHSHMTPLFQAGCLVVGADVLVAEHQARVERLCRDMAFIGTRADAEDEPMQAGRPEGFFVGCAYVVQGSTLGGKAIHKQLGRLLPTDEGREFFQGSPQDGASWREFCRRLEIFGNKDRRLGDLVIGASYAFDQFRLFLNKQPVLDLI